MVESTKVSGKPIIWRVMVFIYGTMEENMKVSIKMTRNMVMVSISGQMEDNTMVIGLRESNMAWDSIKFQPIKMRSKDSGRTVKESVGLTTKKQV